MYRFARSASKQSDEHNECGTPSLNLRLYIHTGVCVVYTNVHPVLPLAIFNWTEVVLFIYYVLYGIMYLPTLC